MVLKGLKKLGCPGLVLVLSCIPVQVVHTLQSLRPQLRVGEHRGILHLILLRLELHVHPLRRQPRFRPVGHLEARRSHLLPELQPPRFRVGHLVSGVGQQAAHEARKVPHDVPRLGEGFHPVLVQVDFVHEHQTRGGALHQLLPHLGHCELEFLKPPCLPLVCLDVHLQQILVVAVSIASDAPGRANCHRTHVVREVIRKQVLIVPAPGLHGHFHSPVPEGLKPPVLGLLGQVPPLQLEAPNLRQRHGCRRVMTPGRLAGAKVDVGHGERTAVVKGSQHSLRDLSRLTQEQRVTRQAVGRAQRPHRPNIQLEKTVKPMGRRHIQPLHPGPRLRKLLL
mmetsp:Transcript_38936/g.87378  ORF Transcript_38936/g.87378 Transcript_38936/m.87378 type:complete len:337 (+) Transcript_38936:568-1578(+)